MASTGGEGGGPPPPDTTPSRNGESQSTTGNSGFVFPSTSTGAVSATTQFNTSGSSSKRHKRIRSTTMHHSCSSTANAVPGIFTGVPGSLVDKDSEFLCPICFEIYREAHMTKCGHSFCHECILKSMEQSPRCPKCNFQLDTKDCLFPNFILDELVAKHVRKLETEKMIGAGSITKRSRFSAALATGDHIKPMAEELLNAFQG